MNGLYDIGIAGYEINIPWNYIMWVAILILIILFRMGMYARKIDIENESALRKATRNEYIMLGAIIVILGYTVMDITSIIKSSPLIQMLDVMMEDMFHNISISVLVFLTAIMILLANIIVKLGEEWNRLLGIGSITLATISFALFIDMYNVPDILKGNAVEMETWGCQLMWIGILIMVSIAIRKLHRNNGGDKNARI